MTVRTRFAPSPTGYLHIGGARTALYSWLHARKHGGTFVLRIEDTDRERSTDESVQAILDAMDWLGLDYDEGPFYQTQRMDRYATLIQQLLDEGKAYYCYSSKEELDALREQQMANKEKPRYDGRYRDFTGTPPEGVPPVVRFKNPQQGSVIIDDEIKGKIEVQNSELDDLIIARSDGTPTYNFTVVVDDLDMEITHVIRGDDHVNNTPRQINIMEALGGTPPKFGHVPMILGDDGKRLSKRHGAVSVMEYEKEGYLPEAVLNYLVRLGWSHGDQEIFSVEEMTQLFELENVNRAPSAFNTSKLVWLNEQYLKSDPVDRVVEVLKPKLEAAGIELTATPAINDVVVALRERVKSINDFAPMVAWFYKEPASYDEKAAKKQFNEAAATVLDAMVPKIEALEDWQAEALHQLVAAHAEDMDVKMGKVGMPLRVALTGGTNSPDIGITLQLIGKISVVSRLKKAVEFIRSNEVKKV